MAILGLTAAQGDESASGTSDQQFVLKASAGGLAEVNMGEAALKHATNPEVKKFARKMVEDHTKANKELLSLADQKKITPATSMDAEHEKMSARLLKLSGAEFDRAYMAGQVKDHEVTVALFEKEAKGGQDADLKGWAKNTLPHLRTHLKMAKQIHDKLKSDKSGNSSSSR